MTQTDEFIVVSKSANVNFHDEGKLGAGLFSQVKTALQHQNINAELYPVHRLDKITSGLLIFATNNSSANMFGELFKNHQIEKYYLALSDKKPIKKQGLIKGDMAKSRRGMFKLLRTLENPAVTQFFSYSVANKQRLYLLKPHSGKTHQLRVALNSIGAPILGDPLYYPEKKAQPQTKSTINRGYLHAYALRFTLFGQTYKFVLPPSEGSLFLTENVHEKIAQLQQPWLLNWPTL